MPISCLQIGLREEPAPQLFSLCLLCLWVRCGRGGGCSVWPARSLAMDAVSLLFPLLSSQEGSVPHFPAYPVSGRISFSLSHPSRKASGYWSHESKAISMTHPSTESSTQAEASINFVKIDFIIIKCHFKQMPHHPTPLETRVGVGVQSNISHHSKGNMQRDSPRQGVTDGMVRGGVEAPLPTLNKGCMKIAA